MPMAPMIPWAMLADRIDSPGSRLIGEKAWVKGAIPAVNPSKRLDEWNRLKGQ
jgi:hypothetical protein